MTFPSIVSTAVTDNVAAASPQSASLPAGIVAGDVLLLYLASTLAFTSLTLPAGWVKLLDDLSTDGQSIWWKPADGTEGSTVAVAYTAAGSRPLSGVCARISGADSSATPSIASTRFTGTPTWDPPSNTPSWGALDTRWFAACQQSSRTVSAAPTGYSSVANGGGTSAADIINVYSRTNNTATEDPSAFTLSANAAGMCSTIGVKPSSNPGAFLQLF